MAYSDATCLVDGCDSNVKARGMCNKHWIRWKKDIPLTKKSQLEKTLHERFSESYRVDDSGCWIWTGETRGRGDFQYGKLWFKGKQLSAHRVSYELHIGKIPSVDGDYRGACVCHSCDTPLCVNPNHLFVGTHKENMEDKVAKGRDRGSRTTHCPRGHKYTESNTYVSKSGLRNCRVCHRDSEIQRRERLRSN